MPARHEEKLDIVWLEVSENYIIYMQAVANYR